MGGLAHTTRNDGDSERDRPTELERPAPSASSWVNEWFGCNADDSRKDGKTLHVVKGANMPDLASRSSADS